MSFASPCVLPLAPVYIAILAGPDVLDAGQAKPRVNILLHSAVFVSGFTAVFVAMGAGAGLTGLAVQVDVFILHRIAAIMLIVFGSLLLAGQRFPHLAFQQRLSPSQVRATGYARSFVIGVIFSMVAMSCASYILGGILMLAFASETAWRGAGLLAVYSLGLGVPFLVMGAAFDVVKPALAHIQRHARALYLASGVLLVVLGILLFNNRLSWL